MKLYPQTNQIVQFADGVTVPPGIPAAGAGADLSPLRIGGGSYQFQRITLDRDFGGPTLTGPVEFGGEANGKIYKLGVLNDGDDIPLTAAKGFAAVVRFVGVYDRFWLEPVAVAGGGGYDGFIEGIEDSA